MFHYIYLLQSEKSQNLYIGYTKNLRRRLEEHNLGLNFSTKADKPWKIIFYEAYASPDDAKRREKYLKTNQGSRTLKRMIKECLYCNQ